MIKDQPDIDRLAEALQYVQSEYVDTEPGEPDWALTEVLRAAKRTKAAEADRDRLADALQWVADKYPKVMREMPSELFQPLRALSANTPDFSKCNCGAGPHGIHARWCRLVVDRNKT